MARIITSLAVLFTVLPADAGSFWVQLNALNMDNQPLAFKVETQTTPQGGVLFQVDIESKQAVLSRNVVASLNVTCGRKQIISVDLEKKPYDKGVRFSFEVSPKFLAESKFQFKDLDGAKNPWANDVYWFLLKDFSTKR